MEENDIELKVTNGLDLGSSFYNDILQPSQEWLQDVEVDSANLDADGDLCVKERKKIRPLEK